LRSEAKAAFIDSVFFFSSSTSLRAKVTSF
jgi:hypothetical protein